MGYVAVQGGVTAIESSQKLNRYLRLKGSSAPLTVSQIMEQMGPLVDRVMSEGGLFSPFHAALAIKQASGDPIEAAFLLRAYRSTLRRLVDSLPVHTEEMRILRRISSAFKTIPGGQVLGSTSDYEQRILDFSLAEETTETQQRVVGEFEAGLENANDPLEPARFRKVVDMLRDQDLVPPVPPVFPCGAHRHHPGVRHVPSGPKREAADACTRGDGRRACPGVQQHARVRKHPPDRR